MEALSETASYNCEFCGSLLDQICEKLEIENGSLDYKVLTFTFDYIKKIPERNPKLARRKNGEPYIVHLVETARLLLSVSKKLTLKQIVISLLHDSIEDVKEIDVNELTYNFGKEIADSVRRLSKEEIPSYITQSIREEKKIKRNIEYCESLKDLDDFELDVKFCDRIHNLRTLYGLDKKFIIKVIEETCRYFLPLASKRNIKACDLMFNEIVKLYQYLEKNEISEIIPSNNNLLFSNIGKKMA